LRGAIQQTFTTSVHLKSGMIRMVVSLEGGNSVKIHYLSRETTILIMPDFRCTEVVKFC
jgi:hypothetical protein